MDWIQFFGFILTVGGLFLWSRTEASADRRELRQVMDTNFKAIQQEMKDFHGKLLVLEDRYLRLREKE